MEKGGETFKVLMNLSSELSGMSALLVQVSKKQDEGFAEIREKVFQFAERLIALELSVAETQKDIANRTHSAETNRISGRLQELEDCMKLKADNRLLWWVMGIIGGLFGLALTMTAASIEVFK